MGQNILLVLFGLAVKLKRCQFVAAQTLCAFDEHLVCIKTWECVYFPSEPTKSSRFCICPPSHRHLTSAWPHVGFLSRAKVSVSNISALDFRRGLQPVRPYNPLHAQLSSSALRRAHFITRIAGMKTTSRILFQVFVCRFLKVEHCRLAAAFAYHFANLHISKE